VFDLPAVCLKDGGLEALGSQELPRVGCVLVLLNDLGIWMRVSGGICVAACWCVYLCVRVNRVFERDLAHAVR